MRFFNEQFSAPLLTVALFLSSIVAFAGPGGTGGGHVTADHQLYDNAVLKTQKPIDVTTLAAYQKFTLPVLERMGTLLPGFEQDLLQGLTEKPWVVQSADMACATDGFVRLHGYAAACQDKYEVKVSRRALAEPSQTVGRLILHELIRALVIRKGTDSAAIDYLTPFLETVTTTDQLNNELVRMGFDRYATPAQFAQVQGVIAEIEKGLPRCSSPNASTMTQTEKTDFVMKFQQQLLQLQTTNSNEQSMYIFDTSRWLAGAVDQGCWNP